MEDRKRQLARLLAHDTLEVTRSHLEALADAFERLAGTPEQHALADEFSQFVGDTVRRPLAIADLGRLAGWLQAYAGRFEQLAATREEEELAEGLAEFAEECGQTAESYEQSDGWLDIAAELADRIDSLPEQPEAPPLAEQFQHMLNQLAMERLAQDPEQTKDTGIER